jgi:hypothetical protein
VKSTTIFPDEKALKLSPEFSPKKKQSKAANTFSKL